MSNSGYFSASVYLSLGTPKGPCTLNTCLRRTLMKYKKGAGYLFHDYKYLWARYNELHVTRGGATLSNSRYFSASVYLSLGTPKGPCAFSNCLSCTPAECGQSEGAFTTTATNFICRRAGFHVILFNLLKHRHIPPHSNAFHPALKLSILT